MVVPCLRSHLYRNEQTGYTDDGCNNGFVSFEATCECLDDGCNAHTAPYCKGIERTGIGIVALTWLHRCLVEVEHDGKTGHEEEEQHYPELADAFLTLAQ